MVDTPALLSSFVLGLSHFAKWVMAGSRQVCRNNPP